MNIFSISPGAIASSVWQITTRTLTADPATDAGSGTIVWAHAARSLTVDPATDAGAATLVWTHATRSLTVDPAAELNNEGAFIAPSTSATISVLGSYVQVIASTAHSVRGLRLSVEHHQGAVRNIRVAISTGGSGSEVIKTQCRLALPDLGSNHVNIDIDQTIIPKTTRVAIAVANETASETAFAVNIGVVLCEAND